MAEFPARSRLFHDPLGLIEAGIAMPSRQTDASPQKIDWLCEAIAEYISGPHNGRGFGNGKAYGTPQVSP